MLKKVGFWGGLAGLGFLLANVSGAIAGETQMNAQPVPTNQFQAIEQPFSHKVAVTVAGLGLIGLELWWFLPRKPKQHS